MAQTAASALAAAKLYSDNNRYALIKLPAAAITAAAGILAEISEPFGALIIDKDEVTLVMYADAVDDFARRMPGYEVAAKPYRLITFDLVLEPTLTGFMAFVAKALADAGVSIIPLGAFSRDHILVPADQYDTATAALNKLKSSVK